MGSLKWEDMHALTQTNKRTGDFSVQHNSFFVVCLCFVFLHENLNAGPGLQRKNEYVNEYVLYLTQIFDLQNWRLRLTMASTAPPTTTRRRKRLRASMLSCDWSTSFSVSHPAGGSSLQSGHNSVFNDTEYNMLTILESNCFSRFHTNYWSYCLFLVFVVVLGGF